LSVWAEPEDFAATVGVLCSRLKALPADPLRFAGQTRALRCRQSATSSPELTRNNSAADLSTSPPSKT
jgi:hypothetical protein